jgi:hypothetical protein
VSFTVYGLRLKGDCELRYVGHTRKTPDERLRMHHVEGSGTRWPFPTWLRENRGNIEAFPIAKVDTLQEARAYEMAIIALCSRLRQRLFNRYGLAPEHRRPTERQAERMVSSIAAFARHFATPQMATAA